MYTNHSMWISRSVGPLPFLAALALFRRIPRCGGRGRGACSAPFRRGQERILLILCLALGKFSAAGGMESPESGIHNSAFDLPLSFTWPVADAEGQLSLLDRIDDYPSVDSQYDFAWELRDSLLRRLNSRDPVLNVKEEMALLLTAADFDATDVSRGARDYIERDYAKLYRFTPGVDDFYKSNPYRNGSYGLGEKSDHQKNVAAIQTYLTSLEPRDAAKAVYDHFALPPGNPLHGLSPADFLSALRQARDSATAFAKNARRMGGVGEIKKTELRQATLELWRADPVTSGALALGVRRTMPDHADDAWLDSRFSKGLYINDDSYDHGYELHLILEMNYTPESRFRALRNRASSDSFPLQSSDANLLWKLLRLEDEEHYTKERIELILTEHAEEKLQKYLSQVHPLDSYPDGTPEEEKKRDADAFKKYIDRTKEIYENDLKKRLSIIENDNPTEALRRMQALAAMVVYGSFASCRDLPAADLLAFCRDARNSYPAFLDDLSKTGPADHTDGISSFERDIGRLWLDNPIAALFMTDRLDSFSTRGEDGKSDTIR